MVYPSAVVNNILGSVNIAQDPSPNMRPLSRTPLVSIVIPTYNRARQTIAAIESVLGQTYPHFEVIVVDDGSTDNSQEVLQRFTSQKRGPHRVLLSCQRNQGVSIARNAGTAKTKGEYIAFLDSDDLWTPEKLDWQLRAFEQCDDKCGVCFTDARLVNNAGMDVSSFDVHRRRYKQTIGIDPNAMMSLAKSFSGFWVSTLLVRTDIFKQVGGFTPDLTFAEDRDLHFRLSLVSPIGYVNKQLVVSDRTPSSPGSTCRPWDNIELQLRQQQLMYEKWLSMDDTLPAKARKVIEGKLGALHSQRANWYLENARYPEARQAVSTAVRYKVTPGTTLKFAMTWLSPALTRKLVPTTRPIGTGGHAS